MMQFIIVEYLVIVCWFAHRIFYKNILNIENGFYLTLRKNVISEKNCIFAN